MAAAAAVFALCCAPAMAAPDRAVLQAGQGVSALLRGQYEKAIDAYTEALASPDLSDVRRANIYNDRGVAKWRLKRAKAAIADFNKAIELFPDYAVVYNNRGNALMTLERPDQAIKDFDRAIVLAPAYGAAHNNRGNALLALNRRDEAHKAFAKAVELMPNNAVPLNGRGKVNAELERPFAAMRDLNRAILLDAKYGSAYRNRAKANLSLDRNTLAIADLTKAIGNQSADAALYLARARAHAKLKRFGPALKDLSKAIELEPDVPDVYVERGKIYADLKSFKQAQKDFTKALSLAPNLTSAYIGRARTFARMGTPQAGLTDANRALAIDPQSAAALRVRAEVYDKLERADDAQADYAKADELDPAGGQKIADGGAQGREPLLPPEGEIIGEVFEGWAVRRRADKRFEATHPSYPELRVPLEMYGAGEPRILEWKTLKNALRGIGLLRYLAGTTNEGDNLEYIAIVDLWKKSVVAIEPHNLGGRVAKWAWADVAVVVTDPAGTPSEIRLRQARRQQDQYGDGMYDDWMSGNRPPPDPRRRTRPRGLFDWLFGR